LPTCFSVTIFDNEAIAINTKNEYNGLMKGEGERGTAWSRDYYAKMLKYWHGS
jgi:hypothetical protein